MSSPKQPIVTASGDRLIERWRREHNAGPGWTVGYHVIVPASEVTSPRPLPGRDVVVRGVSPRDHATYFTLVWATPDAARRELPPQFPDTPSDVVRVFDMPNGDRVWLLTYEARLTEAVLEQIATGKRNIRHWWRRDSGMPIPGARGWMSGEMPNGSRFIIDVDPSQ